MGWLKHEGYLRPEPLQVHVRGSNGRRGGVGALVIRVFNQQLPMPAEVLGYNGVKLLAKIAAAEIGIELVIDKAQRNLRRKSHLSVTIDVAQAGAGIGQEHFRPAVERMQ